MSSSGSTASVSPVVAPQVAAGFVADSTHSGQDGVAATEFATALAGQVDLLQRDLADTDQAVDTLVAKLAEQIGTSNAEGGVPPAPIDMSILQACIAQALSQPLPQDPIAPAPSQLYEAQPPIEATVTKLVTTGTGTAAGTAKSSGVPATDLFAVTDTDAQPGASMPKDGTALSLAGPAQFAATLTSTAESAAAKPVPDVESPAAVDLPVHGDGNTAHAQARLSQAAQEAQQTPSVRVESSFGSRQWTEDVGQKIVWAAGRNEGRAELVLHPPHLGRLEVAITVSSTGDSTALFVSANPQVRDALEQSLPRLREIMAEAGIALGQASIQSDSGPRDDRDQQPATAAGSRVRAGAGNLVAAELALGRQGNRLVDTFA
jgi:flagellar hook-length control protein FliK